MKKSFIILTLTALAAFCLCLTAQAEGPVVVSDKDDYSPGETALFSTTGFHPGELLDFSVAIQGDDGTWIADIAWADIPADATGSAEVDYIVPETWADKTLQLTVMGLTSGLVATTTFTDAAADVHNVNFKTVGLPNGTSISTSGTKTNPSGHFGAYGPVTFVTPSSSGDEGTTPSTELTFTGFPVTVLGVGGHYSLTSFTLTTGTAPGTLHNLDLSTGSGGYTTGGQNNGGGVHATIVGNYTFAPGASPTPTPSATPSATPCQNHPPVIACSGSDADLGAVVGCLGTGTGFGQTFPVSYSQDGPGPSVTVTATFTLPDTTTVSVPVVTVTDPDGDSVMVNLSNGTTSVTINGPGSNSAPFSIDIQANDAHDCNNTEHHTCGANANAQIAYGFNGFFSPLSNVATTKVKQGSAVPVKFQLTDCSGTLITPANMPGNGSAPTVNVVHVSGAAPSGSPTVDDTGNSNGDTDFCRWDPTGLQWIFNLKTNTTYYLNNTYGIQVLPNDNKTHQALISIK